MTTEASPPWYLRQWLVHVGRLQAWLVETADIDKGQISKLVSGKQEWTPTTRRRIADAFRTIDPKFQDWWLSDVDPLHPGSDLQLIRAVAAVPKAKREDVVKMIGAVGESPPPRPAPPPRPKKTARRKRA